MSHYVFKLEQERLQKAAVEIDTRRTLEIDAARERLTPLAERLNRQLLTIPLEVQREGLSLASLQVMLRGRWRGSAHAGQVGTALRGLGWTRQRSWHRGQDGFSALWYPPGST